jgi:hypothetical protein
MKLLHVVPTLGLHCGLAVLATATAERLANAGFDSQLSSRFLPDAEADVVLLWFHCDLSSAEDVRVIGARSDAPVALFLHSTGAEDALDYVDGVLAMSPGLVPSGAPNPHIFPYPAALEPVQDRAVLRRRLGLPLERRVLGTCGFLRFERQFDELASRLLPKAQEKGWFVQITTSPWYVDSPGLIDRLERLRRRYPANFGIEHRHLEEVELILRMQACDLLWCWTDAPSSPYASGVVATQYASGTRLVVADKLQHELVFGLPNVVRGPRTLERFVATLAAEADSDRLERHDPTPVSWGGVVPGVAGWLRELVHTDPHRTRTTHEGESRRRRHGQSGGA